MEGWINGEQGTGNPSPALPPLPPKKEKEKKIHKTKQLKLYDQEGKANRNLASIQQ